MRLLLGLLMLAACLTACNLGTDSSFQIATDDAQDGDSVVVLATSTPRPTSAPTSTPQPSTATPITSAPANPPARPNCTLPAGWTPYTVAPGETLFRIAQRAGSNVVDVAAANCLSNPAQIQAGQVIYLPQAPGPVTPSGDPLAFYLIIPEDNGVSGPAVGCGDSAIAVNTQQARSGSPAQDVTNSLNALFAVDNENYGQSGFINALYNAPLNVQHVELSGDVLVVDLGGALSLVGTCADARMEAQLMWTIFQHPGFNRAYITASGQNLKQIFDASGLEEPNATYSRVEFDQRWRGL